MPRRENCEYDRLDTRINYSACQLWNPLRENRQKEIVLYGFLFWAQIARLIAQEFFWQIAPSAKILMHTILETVGSIPRNQHHSIDFVKICMKIAPKFQRSEKNSFVIDAVCNRSRILIARVEHRFHPTTSHSLRKRRTSFAIISKE